MGRAFEVVLTCSLSGSVITGVLLALKPLLHKKLPVRWQYILWLTALLALVLPLYLLIPAQQAETMLPQLVPIQTADPLPPAGIPAGDAPRGDPLPILWLAGFGGYLAVVLVSYAVFLRRNRGHNLPSSPELEAAKQKLGITRTIPLKISPEVQSPMLAGLFFPTLLLPCRDFSPEMLTVIFLHELTHYRRKDLWLKWFALVVNALHWFNPLVWLLRANISQVCELACDGAVTRDMSPRERDHYMNTILSLGAL